METYINNNSKILNYRIWLGEEFTKRCKRNPRYSLRSFAKLLELDPSTLSQILSGKRNASAKMIQRLCNTLGVSPIKEKKLIAFANQNNKRNQIKNEEEDQFHAKQLTLDAFAIISDWYHYAILELTFVDNFKNDIRWVASKLDITTVEANQAIERLKRLNLLKVNNGKLIKTDSFITNFSEGVTSVALKNMQKSILKMAMQAIDDAPAQEKDITGMTIAINEENLPKAREYIKNFRRGLVPLLEKGKQTRVYHLGVQLYPITKK